MGSRPVAQRLVDTIKRGCGDRGKLVNEEVPVRKIFSFHVTSVDGYYQGPNQEFDWPIIDEEFNQFALQQLDEIDTLLFGRVTYQLMASY